MNRSASDNDSGFCSPDSSESNPSSPDSSSNASSPPPPNMQENDQPRQGALGVSWYGPLFNFMEYIAAQRIGDFYNAGMSGLGGAATPGMGGVVDYRSMQGSLGMSGVLGAYGAAGAGLGAIGGFGGHLFSGFQPHFNYPLGAGAVLGNYGVVGAPGFMQPYLNRLHGRPVPLPVPLQPFNEISQGYANQFENAELNRLPNVCRETHSSSSDGESVYCENNARDNAPLQSIHAESIDRGLGSCLRQRTGESSTYEARTVSDAGTGQISETTLPCSTHTESNPISEEHSRNRLEGEPGTSREVHSVTSSESALRTVPELQTGECFESPAVTCSEIQPGTSSVSQPGTSHGNSLGMRRCLICDYVTPDMNDLMVHIDVHFSVPTYLCADCVQLFRNKEELETHLCPCRDP